MHVDLVQRSDPLLGPLNAITDDADVMIARMTLIAGSSALTDDMGGASDLAEDEDPLKIGVSLGIAAAMAYFPFGGQKDSFFGTLYGQGKDAVQFFTDSKVVITRW